MRYDEDGRKVKWADTAKYKYGGGDVGQQEHRKWSEGKPERGLTDRGRRGDEGVGKNRHCWASNEGGYRRGQKKTA